MSMGRRISYEIKNGISEDKLEDIITWNSFKNCISFFYPFFYPGQNITQPQIGFTGTKKNYKKDLLINEKTYIGPAWKKGHRKL